MTSELQNKLVKKYPEYFDWLKEYDGPGMPVALFGFECGDGWYVLLNELMYSIKSHVKNENRNRDYQMKWKFGTWLQVISFRHGNKYNRLNKLIKWSFMKMPRGAPHIHFPRITQVKEKFGGLRFYYDGGDNVISGMVSLTESLSYRTCETCGSTKDVGQTKGWITTICKKCVKENDVLNWTQYKD